MSNEASQQRKIRIQHQEWLTQHRMAQKPLKPKGSCTSHIPGERCSSSLQRASDTEELLLNQSCSQTVPATALRQAKPTPHLDSALWANSLPLSMRWAWIQASRTPKIWRARASELLHLSFKGFLSAGFMISAQHHANCSDIAAYS